MTLDALSSLVVSFLPFFFCDPGPFRPGPVVGFAVVLVLFVLAELYKCC